MTDDRRPAITPALALRVAVLGGIALVLFAIVFFRLWYLQVLSGDQYLVQANSNRVRDVKIPAPRGEIVDRHGRVIVKNRSATVVQLKPASLPEAERDAAAAWGQRIGLAQRRVREQARRDRARRVEELRRQGREGRRRALRVKLEVPKVEVPLPPIATPRLRERYEALGKVLGMRPSTIHKRVIEQLAMVPYSNVTLRSDVSASVRDYLLERRERFPGVEVSPMYLRDYPQKHLAAQLLGTVGEISPDELEEERFREVRQGTIVGKSGIERSYDRYLRGRDGATRLQVDALGNPTGELRHARRDPTPGKQLRLSLDLTLQKAAQDAVGAIGGGRPGAFVAMDPRNGEVLAMGSYPSFDPNIFAKPISRARFDALNSEESGAPLFNRAIAAVYPTGSTFKPVTALAGLDSGVITPGTTISDGGCLAFGGRDWCNAGKVANGAVDLRRSLEVSSDIFYYLIGRDTDGIKGRPLQKWARKLGFGRRSGIDLPGEITGLVPDPEWRAGVGEEERRCRKRNKVPACGISDMRPWSAGDNMNLSIGQGDLQATPLQLAVAYSAIVSKGRVPRPHLGLQVQTGGGALLQEIEPGAARRIKLPEAWRAPIMDGLHRAAAGSGGTSTAIFANWPHGRLPVFGKTGTAETFVKGAAYDQSWYVAYVPHKSRPIAVAVTVERGGFGADTAAPIACRILGRWFSLPGRPCDASVEAVRD